VQTCDGKRTLRSRTLRGSRGENRNPNFGRCLVFGAKPFKFELIFPDPAHKFDTGDDDKGIPEPLQAKHRPQAKIDRSMILFNEVIQVF
jgi:hypothetical protein